MWEHDLATWNYRIHPKILGLCQISLGLQKSAGARKMNNKMRGEKTSHRVNTVRRLYKIQFRIKSYFLQIVFLKTKNIYEMSRHVLVKVPPNKKNSNISVKSQHGNRSSSNVFKMKEKIIGFSVERNISNIQANKISIPKIHAKFHPPLFTLYSCYSCFRW